MSFLPTPSRKPTKALAAVIISGTMVVGATAVPAAAENQAPSAGSSTLQPAAAASSPFTDVTWNTKYSSEIAWVASSGISTGWPDGTYRPLAPVSREAMAAFLHRLDALKGVKDELPGAVPQFSDVAGLQFEGEIG